MDTDGIRKLFNAVRRDHVKRFDEIVDRIPQPLLDGGVLRDLKLKGETLLSTAVERRSWKVVARLLVERHLKAVLITDDLNICKDAFVPMIECGQSELVAKCLQSIRDKCMCINRKTEEMETNCRNEMAKLLKKPINDKNDILLHAAARKNALTSFRDFLDDDCCFDPKKNNGQTASIDAQKDNGQTFLLDTKNDDGHTPLHVAAKSGSVESIEILLRHDAMLDARDDKGNTPLHLAAIEGNYATLVFLITWIETMYEGDGTLSKKKQLVRLTSNDQVSVDSDCIKLNINDTQNRVPGDQDKRISKSDVQLLRDSTAAISTLEKRRITLFLTNVNGRINNDKPPDEDTEINNGTPTDKITFTNQKLPPSFIQGTPLSISNRRGDVKAVKLFLEHGYVCHAILQDLLTDLITTSVGKDSAFIDKLIEVYRVIVDYCEHSGRFPTTKEVFLSQGATCTLASLLRRCVTSTDEDLKTPLIVNYDLRTMMRSKSIQLNNIRFVSNYARTFDTKQSDVKNESDNINMLELACKLGATRFVGEILNTENVYRFNDWKRKTVYDVTNIIPETRHRDNVDGETCLELILKNADNTKKNRAWQMLDVEPIRQMTEKYWHLGEVFVYGIIVIHVLYMSLFVHYYVPDTTNSGDVNKLRCRFPAIGNGTCPVEKPVDHVSGIWILWPLILVFCTMMPQLVSWMSNSAGTKASELQNFTPDEQSNQNAVAQMAYNEKTWLNMIFRFIESAFNFIAGANLFLALIVTWYCAYTSVSIFSGATYAQYFQILAVTVICGWMETLQFFSRIDSYRSMLLRFSNIVFKDVFSMFLILYLMIVLGFGFALHVIGLIGHVDHGRSHIDSIYNTFLAMMTQGDIFSSDISNATNTTDFIAAGGNLNIYRIVFSLYIILSTIILLNILIAMMNNTYAHDKPNTKKLQNVAFNVLLYNMCCGCWKWQALSFFLGSTKPSHLLRSGEDDGFRYYLWVPKQGACDSETADDTLENGRDDDIAVMKSKMSELKNRMDEVVETCARLTDVVRSSSIRSAVDSHNLKWPTKIRERF